MISEILKLLTIPCVLDGIIADIISPAKILVIKRTGESFHIGRNIHAPPSALAGINAVWIDVVGVIQNGGDRTGVESNLERSIHMVDDIKELFYPWIVCR